MIVRNLKGMKEREAERQVEDEELFDCQISATLWSLTSRQKAMKKIRTLTSFNGY